jgi:hypothetical protein
MHKHTETTGQSQVLSTSDWPGVEGQYPRCLFYFNKTKNKNKNKLVRQDKMGFYFENQERKDYGSDLTVKIEINRKTACSLDEMTRIT